MEAALQGAHSTLAALVLCLFTTDPAHAAWPSDPRVNVPVCTAPNNQYVYKPVSDGAGGIITAWQDYRGGSNYDVYAQHVLAAGVVDPAWPANGLPLCTASGDQTFVQLVEDGAGGAIVTWQDRRSGGIYKVFAQHVLRTGKADVGWPAGGRAVCANAGYQEVPRVVSDGAGGAVVGWTDGRISTQPSVAAQHVLASGAVDPAWPVVGRLLATGAYAPQMVSDGSGGAIIAWLALGSFDRIRSQHLLASGLVDPAWPSTGCTVSAKGGGNYEQQLVSDGAGGAIIAWQDGRRGFHDIYAHHILAAGAVDPNWPADGRLLSGATYDVEVPQLAPDGAGGAIVAWRERRDWYDIYAQHVLAGGDRDSRWPAGGKAMCAATGAQDSPQIVSDGVGGALIAWQDDRNSIDYDIYAQHVYFSGALAPGWPADGRAVCTAASDQTVPQLVPAGVGSAIVIWWDLRNGSSIDLYAQRTPEDLPVPVLASLVTAEWRDGHIALEWSLDGVTGVAVSLERRGADAAWQVLATLQPDGTGRARYADADVRAGQTYVYRLSWIEDGRVETTAETDVMVPAVRGLALRAIGAPATGVELALESPGRAATVVELFDLGGRLLRSTRVTPSASSSLRVRFDGAPLAPGLYLARATQGAHIAKARVIIAR